MQLKNLKLCVYLSANNFVISKKLTNSIQWFCSIHAYCILHDNDGNYSFDYLAEFIRYENGCFQNKKV